MQEVQNNQNIKNLKVEANENFNKLNENFIS